MNYNNLIDKVNTDYNSRITKNTEKIIDTAVYYYGKKYKDIFIDRYNKITFLWFFHKNTFELYNKKVDFKKFFMKSLKLSKESPSILWDLTENKDSIIYNEIIGSTKIINPTDIINEKVKNLLSTTAAFFLVNSEKDYYIGLPTLLTTDDIFFHELDHALTSSVLFESDNGLCVKTGLSLSSNEDILLNEIIDQICAGRLAHIYREKNGYLFNPLPTKKIYNNYEEYFDPIVRFYDKYKEIIDEARISENKNIIFKYIDKEKYNELNKYIHDRTCVSPHLTQGEKQIINYMINKMYITSKNEMNINEYQNLNPNKKIRLIRK